MVDINAISVAILTESWLTENTPNSAVALYNFATYRLDRRSPGGGVLVYVNHKIRAKRLPEFEVEREEVLWLLFNPPRMPRPFSTILLVAVYFPPGQSNARAEKLLPT